MLRIAFALPAALMLVGCATTDHPTAASPLPVATSSVEPGTAVKRGGQAVELEGDKGLGIDQTLPAVALTDSEWAPFTFKADGKVKLVSVVPSIDTRVCEQQTHILGEASALDPRVERITVSRDLPAAQKRFALESNLTNVTYLSDYRAGSFGRATGLLMKGSDLLARAVFVVDGQGKVRYLQVVPEVSSLPDMPRAIAEANELVK
jgi:thiol peroxidase